jgi:hypothetical protein
MAELLAFPSTEILSKVEVPVGPLLHTADPNFMLVRPFGRVSLWDPNAKRTAAVELATGRVIISETPALDVFGRRYIAEQFPWVVGLYERGKGLQATVPLHEK